ncbi:MAG: AAA family ATPase [Rickettsiales bacterium]|nr:AAA family ATPase [Rickettsiales bacterium]
MKQDLSTITFNQKMISFLSSQTTSTVSRYMNEQNIPFIKEFGNSRKRYSFDETRKAIKELSMKQGKIREKIQVFFNFKGGTGKTSICHQTAVHLTLLGFSVLAIDCDPQAHLSASLGFNEYSDDLTLYDVLINNLQINEVIKPVYPGLDIVPSNLSMTKIELPLSQKPGRERILDRSLEPVKNKYDFILIDTNPTISVLNHSATYAAHRLNIVCETQPYSLKGLDLLIEEIKTFSSAMEHQVNYCIIPNKYESKTVTAQEALGSLRHTYKELVTESLIRKCEEFNISAKKSLPIHAFSNTKSIALEDIRDLVNELVENALENKVVAVSEQNEKVKNEV